MDASCVHNPHVFGTYDIISCRAGGKVVKLPSEEASFGQHCHKLDIKYWMIWGFHRFYGGISDLCHELIRINMGMSWTQDFPWNNGFIGHQSPVPAQGPWTHEAKITSALLQTAKSLTGSLVRKMRQQGGLNSHRSHRHSYKVRIAYWLNGRWVQENLTQMDATSGLQHLPTITVITVINSHSHLKIYKHIIICL